MDELPQLVNIAKGICLLSGRGHCVRKEIELAPGSEVVDMSNIPGFEKRTGIRPGLTGFAQVFASRNLPGEENSSMMYGMWRI